MLTQRRFLSEQEMKRYMTRHMVRLVGVIAVLAIGLAGVAAPVNFAAANAPAAPMAQAEAEKGVLIVSVQRDGPAAKAGIRRGDIVLKVNDVEVNDAQALRDALARLKPGDEARVRIARGDSELTITVVLGEADGRAILGVTPFQSLPPTVEAMPARPGQDDRPALPMDPEQMRKRLQEQLQRFSSQVRVTEVIADSPAAKAGLQRGDIIVAVNEAPLSARNTLADSLTWLKPGDVVTLTIRRNDAEQKLQVTLGEHPNRQGAAFLGIRYAPTFGVMGLPGRLPLPGRPGDDARPLELPEAWSAVTIGDVVTGSPADKAGLKKGDMIIAANDREIREPGDLVSLVQGSKPGDTVVLSVRRAEAEKPVEITVTLGEHPDREGVAYLGVSLGPFIRFERVLPGAEGSEERGFEIIPGFRLPFDFGHLPFPLPQIPDIPEMRREA